MSRVDINLKFPLLNLAALAGDSYDGCTPSAVVPTPKSALYLRIASPFNCPFTTVVNNLQALDPALVLIGSDGPLVSHRLLLLLLHTTKRFEM